MPEADQQAAGISPSQLRLSVGIEDVEDQWVDIEDALGEAATVEDNCYVRAVRAAK